MENNQMDIVLYEKRLKNITKHEATTVIEEYNSLQESNKKEFYSAIETGNLEKAFETAKTEHSENRIKYFSEIIKKCKLTGRVSIAKESALLMGIHLDYETLSPMLEYHVTRENLDSVKEILSLLSDAHRQERVCFYIDNLSLRQSFRDQILYINFDIDTAKPKQNNNGSNRKKNNYGNNRKQD